MNSKKKQEANMAAAKVEFDIALTQAGTKIVKVDVSKQRQVSTNRGTMSVQKFCDWMVNHNSKHASEYKHFWKVLTDTNEMEKFLIAYAKDNGILRGNKFDIEIPEYVKELTLNINISAKGKDDKFFLTRKDETVSEVSGEQYLTLMQLTTLEAASIARKVVPQYMPRASAGINIVKDGRYDRTVFNTYHPPSWTKIDQKNVPDSLPELFAKLVNHLFPIQLEREYFFEWLRKSLFERAYVYLILNGAPGSGKNRLKLVLRALHGHQNTVDGKKSTLVERFNSQFTEATLAWFDELQYDVKMENTMKELQNDSISIERKGVDATKSTRIHASIIISNNKPRDNYIAFDARKFSALTISAKRLEESMTPEEIDLLTKKVEDPSTDTFDPMFLSQIVKWIKKNANNKKWPNLEYKGPMFWNLAQTSMSRWQKTIIMQALDPNARTPRNGYDENKKSFLWSTFQSKAMRKIGDRNNTFPDFTTVRYFLETFKDLKGRQAFTTESIDGLNILGDFRFKPIFKNPEISTEALITEQDGVKNAKTKKQTLDL